MSMANPFSPSFGTSPPLLVGRQQLIDAFVQGLEDGPGAPARATLYTGQSGVGKTALLNAIEDRAREFGWIVISEDASQGLVDRLTSTRIPAELRQLAPSDEKRRLTGVSSPFGGIDWKSDERYPLTPDLGHRLSELVELCEDQDRGLVVTVDEVHAGQRGEVVAFANAVQHLIREGREIAAVLAGLPRAVHSRVLTDRDNRPITFVRRADRHVLGPVDLTGAEIALREPIVQAGRTIDDSALWAATKATKGYPFMIQLVGYHVWQAASGDAITAEDVTNGVKAATRRIGDLVYAPVYADLNPTDRAFLAAMAHDAGPSKLGDIAARMDVTGNRASQYRQHLLEDELIERAGYGHVDFAMPFMDAYLRELLDIAPVAARTAARSSVDAWRRADPPDQSTRQDLRSAR
jgi:hypothetical protein